MMYKLICDSCTDLPREVEAEANVEKVPLSLLVGADNILDDGSVPQTVLLKKISDCDEASRSACPSPAQYLDTFSDECDNYVVTLSAALSGSNNAAKQAEAIYREEGGRSNVHVFNSRSASAGQVQIALLIRELCAKGLPFADVVDQVESYIHRMKTMFVLENLETFRKNGRMTRVQSLVTGALQVKLLMGGNREGEVEKLGQGLSIRQTLARMVTRMANDTDHEGRRLVIAHCNCLERARYVCSLVEAKCRFKEILVVPTGGVSTLYANDGGIITAY